MTILFDSHIYEYKQLRLTTVYIYNNTYAGEKSRGGLDIEGEIKSNEWFKTGSWPGFFGDT
jgi:hypothetical protein